MDRREYFFLSSYFMIKIWILISENALHCGMEWVACSNSSCKVNFKGLMQMFSFGSFCIRGANNDPFWFDFEIIPYLVISCASIFSSINIVFPFWHSNFMLLPMWHFSQFWLVAVLSLAWRDCFTFSVLYIAMSVCIVLCFKKLADTCDNWSNKNTT